MYDLTETKSGNLATWATDINHHHQQACLRAGEAINHAIEAGKLLVKVKQKLPHGEFGGWLEKNLDVTDRQARRYMAAAQGKPVPARVIASKRTPVSVLPAPAKTLHDYFSPSWIPMKGYTYSCATDDGAFWVAHSKAHPGFFHVSHLTEETYSGTRRPVAGLTVEYMLQGYGLAVPEDASWEVMKGDMQRPFGEPEELLAEWKAKRMAF
jgi:hypothetical protein